MGSDLKLSWRNLGRSRRRTALAIVGIALAQLTLIWMSSLMNGYMQLIFDKLTGPMLGHFQIHAPQYRDDYLVERVIPNADEVAQKIRAEPHVKQVSPRLYGPVLVAAQELGHAAMVTGLDLHNEITSSGLFPKLKEAYLPSENEVLIGKGLAAEMRIKPGDKLALMGSAVDGSIASGLYRVKGSVQSDVEQINRFGIVMGLKTAQNLFAMEGRVHEFSVQLDQTLFIQQAISNLRSYPELRSLEILDWKALMPQIAAYLEISGSVTFIVLAFIFLTTTAGIANTMVMATFERRHEFGMLLALGCKSSRLIRILFFESLLLGIIGIVIGSSIGIPMVLYEMQHGVWFLKMTGAEGISVSMQGLDLSMDVFPVLKPLDVVSGFVSVLFTAMVSTIWPARRILRLEPVEVMRT